MDHHQETRREGLLELQRQLAKASSLLDEIEKRSLTRRTNRKEQTEAPLELTGENAETRFAACVALGMAKLKQR